MSRILFLRPGPPATAVAAASPPDRSRLETRPFSYSPAAVVAEARAGSASKVICGMTAICAPASSMIFMIPNRMPSCTSRNAGRVGVLTWARMPMPERVGAELLEADPDRVVDHLRIGFEQRPDPFEDRLHLGRASCRSGGRSTVSRSVSSRRVKLISSMLENSAFGTVISVRSSALMRVERSPISSTCRACRRTCRTRRP